MDDNLIVVGKVVTTHGVKGEIKINPFSNDPRRFSNYTKVFLMDDVSNIGLIGKLNTSSPRNLCEAKINSVRYHKNCVLLELDRIDDVEKAQSLVGKLVAVTKEDLPKLQKGNYYAFELSGLKCLSTQGIEIGVVTDMIEYPSSDCLEIKEPTGKTFLVPMVKEFVKLIDLESGCIVIEDRKGLR